MQKHYFSFSKNNYLIILAGVAMVVLGFILMTGGGSDDPKVFNEAELFSARRITLAPLMVMGGYVVVIFGIMRKPVQQAVSQEKGSKTARNTDIIDHDNK